MDGSHVCSGTDRNVTLPLLNIFNKHGTKRVTTNKKKSSKIAKHVTTNEQVLKKNNLSVYYQKTSCIFSLICWQMAQAGQQSTVAVTRHHSSTSCSTWWRANDKKGLKTRTSSRRQQVLELLHAVVWRMKYSSRVPCEISSSAWRTFPHCHFASISSAAAGCRCNWPWLEHHCLTARCTTLCRCVADYHPVTEPATITKLSQRPQMNWRHSLLHFPPNTPVSQVLLRLSSSRSVQNIGRRVVSIWHDRWQCLSRRSSQHPACPNLLSGCLAMSSLVFQPSSCHLLVFILRPDWLVWLSGVAECDQRIVFFWLLLCRVVPFVQTVPWLRHLWCGRAMKCPRCSSGIGDGKHQSS